MANHEAVSVGLKNSLAAEIEGAIRELDDRGLNYATQWLCEYLNILPLEEKESIEAGTEDISVGDPNFIFAKSQFDLKEYRRCAHTLRNINHPKARFLRWYSLFLAGEKRRQELIDAQVAESRCIENEEMAEIREELSEAHSAGQLDSFGLYMYGICLRACEDPIIANKAVKKTQGRPESKVSARALFLSSVNAFPWNWSAWMDLASTIDTFEALDEVMKVLVTHEFKHLFLAQVYSLFGSTERCLLTFRMLMQGPISALPWVKGGYATALSKYYQSSNSPNFSETQNEISQIFSDLRRDFPFDFRWMDRYAQYLSVNGDKEALCELAMDATENSKWSVQNYLIVGYFHAMHGAVEMALDMIRSARKVDPGCSVGSEVMTMMNSTREDADRILLTRHSDGIVRPQGGDIRAGMGVVYAYELPRYAFYHLLKASEKESLNISDFRSLACLLAKIPSKAATDLSKLISDLLKDPKALMKASSQITQRLTAILCLWATAASEQDFQSIQSGSFDPNSSRHDQSPKTPQSQASSRFSARRPQSLHTSVLDTSHIEEDRYEDSPPHDANSIGLDLSIEEIYPRSAQVVEMMLDDEEMMDMEQDDDI
jgi:hypothetical protein